jgi:glucan phosphorylase
MYNYDIWVKNLVYHGSDVVCNYVVSGMESSGSNLSWMCNGM